MSEFRLKTLVLGMLRTNCYIIYHGVTKEAIVVDPADESDRIEQYLKANDLVCKGILLTHGHFDHILAAKDIALNTHAKIYVHESEAELLSDPEMNCSVQFRIAFGLRADILLKDQQELLLAGFTIKAIHTPGHTVGGTCYYFTDYGILFSGDTLFHESLGRSDFPTGNGRVLVASILNKLMLLEDQVKVFPGHGASTTIGHERDNNIYLSNDPFF